MVGKSFTKMLQTVLGLTLGFLLACFGHDQAIANSVPEGDSISAICYPAPGQQRVELVYPGNEVPDPLPKRAPRPAGYPVTVTFPGANTITNASIELKDDKGLPVAIWESSPEQPAHREFLDYQRTTLCAIPKEPLKFDTRYSASAQATVDGKKWSKSWTFQTADPKPASDRFSSDFFRQLNQIRRQCGLEPVKLDKGAVEACFAHARYVDYHLMRDKESDAYKQDRTLPYSSSIGWRIAPRSLALGLPQATERAADVILESIHARQYLLDPKLTSLGVASHSFSHFQGVTVYYGVYSTQPAGSRPIIFPPRGYPVPVRGTFQPFMRNLGIDGSQDPGYPLSITFPLGERIEFIEGTLETNDGKSVDAGAITINRRGEDGQKGVTCCVVPKQALAYGRTYDARFSVQRSSKRITYYVRFTTAPQQKPGEGLDSNQALCRAINYYRKLAGLQPVSIDRELSVGCYAHAQYLRLHHRDLSDLVDFHSEDPKKKGYSRAGAAAASSSNICLGTTIPTASVEGWLNGLYHRTPLLNPKLKRIGVGIIREQSPSQNWICVVDVTRGVAE